MRRIFQVLAALALTLAVTVPAAAAPARPSEGRPLTTDAQIGGSCSGGQFGNFHLVVPRSIDDTPDYNANYFDRVEGQAYARPLTMCATFYGGSFTAILPANMESLSGYMMQLGYLHDNNGYRFVYAFDDPDAITWPYAFTFYFNHSYKFIIWKNNSYSPAKACFRIYDITPGWEDNTTHCPGDWPTAYNDQPALAWWGAETSEQYAAHGSEVGDPSTPIYYLGYSTDKGGTYYRSGIVNEYWASPWDASANDAMVRNFFWTDYQDHYLVPFSHAVEKDSIYIWTDPS